MSNHLIPEAQIDAAAQRFKLLSETVRLELINQLHIHGEMSVQELVDATGHRQANVSKHLLMMARMGFLGRRKDGLNVFYSIVDPSIAGMCLLASASATREMETAG